MKPARARYMPKMIAASGLLLTAACSAPAQQGLRPGPGAAADRTFKDCADCPEMVVIPAGAFLIGSPAGEAGRAADEGPQREVHFAAPFAMARTEVTRLQYQAFLAETGRAVRGGCITDRRKPFDWESDEQTDFNDPGYRQGDDEPAVCVNWFEATAFVDWLNRRTRGGYRLPTEAEWEYAARAGTTTAYFWGPLVDEGCRYMNGTDQTARDKYPLIEHMACRDGFLNTAPVASFLPNKFGLYDMTGNVGEWTLDCATSDYSGLRGPAPATDGDCSKRMVRGGSWGTIPRQQRSAERIRYAPDARDDSLGFRVMKDLNF